MSPSTGRKPLLLESERMNDQTRVYMVSIYVKIQTTSFNYCVLILLSILLMESTKRKSIKLFHSLMSLNLRLINRMVNCINVLRVCWIACCDFVLEIRIYCMLWLDKYECLTEYETLSRFTERPCVFFDRPDQVLYSQRLGLCQQFDRKKPK